VSLVIAGCFFSFCYLFYFARLMADGKKLQTRLLEQPIGVINNHSEEERLLFDLDYDEWIKQPRHSDFI